VYRNPREIEAKKSLWFNGAFWPWCLSNKHARYGVAKAAPNNLESHEIVCMQGASEYGDPQRYERNDDREVFVPAKLRELGWIVIDKGQETRLGLQLVTHDRRGREKATPTLGNSYGFHQRDVFDVCLP
jgi:hypothetical protein